MQTSLQGIANRASSHAKHRFVSSTLHERCQCEASSSEEPGAEKLHAGICEGAVG